MPLARARRFLTVALIAAAVVAGGCSVKTDEYSSSGDSSDAPLEESDEAVGSEDDSENAIGDANPDELAFVETNLDSDPDGQDLTADPGNGTDAGAANDTDDSQSDAPDRSDASNGGDSNEQPLQDSDPTASTAGSDTSGSPQAVDGGYGSASLDADTPMPTPTPVAGLLGPSATGSADSTGSGADQFAESATRGAILIEAFDVPGARLLSDADRRCVIGEFEAVSGSLRADQVIASLAAEANDVDVLVNALVVCDALEHISTGLIEELDPLLEDRIADQVAECLGRAYGEPQELAAAMKLALTTPENTTDANRQGAFSAVVECVGLGDVVAADTIGLRDEARICLNQIGTDIMDTLLNVEIRGSQANLDSVEIEALFSACLSPTELEVTSD